MAIVVSGSRRGLMFVLSSPSGAGKTTISKMLLADDSNIVMSISATTRPPRPNEVDGQDYFFVDDAQFDTMVAAGEFLEWALVFGHRYGTPRSAVEAALSKGHDILFDIDWQGTQQLAQKVHDDLVRTFILPPSMAALEARLRARAQDSDAIIAGRMARAAAEISHWAEYDYVLINKELDRCLSQVKAILAAERLQRQRQVGLADFVSGLLQS